MRQLKTKAVVFQRKLGWTDLNRKKITHANRMQLSALSHCLSFFFSEDSLVGPLVQRPCCTMLDWLKGQLEYGGSERGRFLRSSNLERHGQNWIPGLLTPKLTCIPPPSHVSRPTVLSPLSRTSSHLLGSLKFVMYCLL